MWTISPSCSRRSSVRSIDITGVIPDPAVRNGSDAGAGSGGDEIALGGRQPHDGARCTPPTRWVDRKPSGIALTAMVIAPARPDVTAADVSEYDRHRHRPSTSSPIPTYWPG